MTLDNCKRLLEIYTKQGRTVEAKIMEERIKAKSPPKPITAPVVEDNPKPSKPIGKKK